MADTPEHSASYEAPGRLPLPYAPARSSALPAYLFGGAASVMLGGAVWAASQLAYVVLVYSVLIGLGIGFALTLGVRWGSSTRGVGLPAVLCAITAFAVFNLALYLDSIHEVEGAAPGFFGFLTYRAQHQALPLGLAPDARVNAGLWVFEVLLTAFVAWRSATETVARVRLEAVPTPVTEFVLFLLFQGRGTPEIKAELAAHGWTETPDVARALAAAEAAVRMIGTADTPAPTKR